MVYISKEEIDMKIRSITNIRRLIVSFALIAMLHVTGCGGLEFYTSAQTVEATETSTDTGYEPVFVHYDGSWHILYKKGRSYNVYTNDHTYVGYLCIWSNYAGTMRLEFEDDSYAIVDSIETVKTFQLSQQQEGTDTDWENLGLKNPNNPD
jgi:hypothetical protein